MCSWQQWIPAIAASYKAHCCNCYIVDWIAIPDSVSCNLPTVTAVWAAASTLANHYFLLRYRRLPSRLYFAIPADNADFCVHITAIAPCFSVGLVEPQNPKLAW